MNPYIPIYVFVVFLARSFVAGCTLAILSLLYILMGFVTFLLYWKDKAAAVSGSWWVKESTFHICALLFGWAEAILAQQNLRHKTQKRSFHFTFWVTVLLNVACIGWLHTDSGEELFRNLINRLKDFSESFDSLYFVTLWFLEFTRFQNWFQ